MVVHTATVAVREGGGGENIISGKILYSAHQVCCRRGGGENFVLRSTQWSFSSENPFQGDVITFENVSGLCT